MLLAVPFVEAATPPQQLAPRGQQPQSVSVSQNRPEIPDTKTSGSEAASNLAEPVYPDDPAPVLPQAQGQGAQSGSDQQQNTPQKPVGTAAAPEEKPVGVAASRPAGAVIAPAKQKRARIILIRAAVIVGAAVAVGTVVALSKGSPSRPN
jgi:hypothetical protein